MVGSGLHLMLHVLALLALSGAPRAQDPLKDAAQALAVAARTGLRFEEALSRLVQIGSLPALDAVLREYPAVANRAEEGENDLASRTEDVRHRERRLAAAKAAHDEKRVELIESDLMQRRQELAKAEKEAAARTQARTRMLEAVRQLVDKQPEPGRKAALARFERGFLPKLDESERGPLLQLYASQGPAGGVGRLVTAMVEAARRKKELERPLPAMQKEEEKARARWAESEAGSQPLKALQDAWIKATTDLQNAHARIHQVERTLRAAARAVPIAIAALPEAERKHEAAELVRGLQRVAGDERWLLMAELGKVREPELLQALRGMVTGGKDAGQVAFALRALGEAQDEKLLELAPACLTHADWVVRAAAIDGLRLLRQAAGIPLLIEALAREDGRLKDDVVRALRSLTGRTYHYDSKLWREWWDKEGAGFVVPPAGAETEAAAGPAEGVNFYGIQSSSKNVLFVIDISRSMTFDPDAVDQETPTTGKPDRMAIAKEQLVAALKGLREGGVFNIVWFSTEVGAFRKGLVPTTKENLAAAVQYVQQELKTIAGTNLYAGLREAFQVAGIGTSDRFYQSRIDTMFLLTDVEGFGDTRLIQGEVTDPDQILDFVRERNQLNRITIHTIGIGTKQVSYFLKRLAEENGGQYQAR